MIRWVAIGSVALCVAFGTEAASGQHRVTRILGNAIACQSCTIERYSVGRVSDSTLPGALQSSNVVRRNTDQSFFILSGPSVLTEVYHARADGQITQQVGRSGSGPGEYTMPTVVTESQQNYLIFDGRQTRITWLSKGDFKVARTSTLPLSVLNATTLPDGRSVAIASGRSAETRDHVLHVINADGKLARSFRRDQRSPSGYIDNLVYIAQAGDSAVFVASSTQYRIEKWSLNGVLLEVIERDVDWFPPYDIESTQKPGARVAFINGISQDSAGMIWVGIIRHRVADPSSGTQFVPGETSTSVEVLDLARSRVVVRSSFRGVNYAVAEGFYRQTKPGTDEPLIDIWAFRL